MVKQPEEPTAEEATEDGKRLDQLEAKQDALSGKIDQILGIISGKPKDPELDAQQGQPAGIASEIRQQLEARDAKNKADEAEAARNGTLADLQAKVAELAEKPPEPMPRRVEKIMGWT